MHSGWHALVSRGHASTIPSHCAAALMAGGGALPATCAGAGCQAQEGQRRALPLHQAHGRAGAPLAAHRLPRDQGRQVVRAQGREQREWREADGGCHCCSMPWCLLPWATVDTPRRFSGPISISTVGPRRPLRRGRREATAHPANPTGGAGRLECTIWRQQLVLCCNAGVRWQPMFRSPLYLACPAPSAHGPHHPAG